MTVTEEQVRAFVSDVFGVIKAREGGTALMITSLFEGIALAQVPLITRRFNARFGPPAAETPAPAPPE